jgi:hypothetical protein
MSLPGTIAASNGAHMTPTARIVCLASRVSVRPRCVNLKGRNDKSCRGKRSDGTAERPPSWEIPGDHGGECARAGAQDHGEKTTPPHGTENDYRHSESREQRGKRSAQKRFGKHQWPIPGEATIAITPDPR